MLNELPHVIQFQIKDLLMKDDFVSAKQIYDQWSASHRKFDLGTKPTLKSRQSY